MSHVNALYHIVFATYERRMTITNEYREDVYRFIWSIISEKRSNLLRIGGIANHIHILLNLHQSVSLSDMVRDIKAKSSGWLRKDNRFPYFEGWAKEYFAATISFDDRHRVIEYIKGQQQHHNIQTFDDEYNEMLSSEGLEMPYDSDKR